jgi:serine/threonine protein kinase
MKSFSPRPRTHGIDTARPASERYRILGRIAAGGMAEIYLGRMVTRSGGWRECVLKRLMPDLQADQEFVQMFYDEARIASQMSHPNIVQIYELGELDGSMFIAMELIRGVNLKELYERADIEKKPLPIALSLRIAVGALDALAYAHSFRDEAGNPQNIVHRDVSPQNILVTYQGEVKLVDFGVAKAENRVHQTRQGLIKGKFAYMAPEQITGEKIDARSDLFALAEVLYQFMLHRHPFYAESDAAVLQAVIESRATPPTTLDPRFPPVLSAIVMRALQRKPENRFPDAAAMKEAIEAYMLDRARPPTAETLGRYVRELFADRLQLEEEARSEDDDDLLVEALRVHPRKPRAIIRDKPKRNIPQRRQGTPPKTHEEQPEERLDLGTDNDPDMQTISVGGSAKDLAALLDDEERSRKEHISGRHYDEPEIDSSVMKRQLSEPADAMATVINSAAIETPVPILEPPPVRRKRSRVERPPIESVVGRQIGPYTLLDRLGGDAICEHFLARLTGTEGFEKRVLIKRILPGLSNDPVFVEAFLREVKLASRLSHPHIAATLDLGIEEGRYYVVSEYVPGTSLAQMVVEARVRNQFIPIGIACHIIADVTAAIASAHSEIDDSGRRRAVLHRDLTPERVIIARHGGVKVIDFGIANASTVSLNTGGPEERRGKPDYMAPEQLSNDFGAPDARCDVYSAGMMLYETLTLESPFRRATTFESILAVLRDPIRSIGSLRADTPKPLELIVEHSLARNPNDRHSSAQALAHDLQKFLTKIGEAVIDADVAAYLRKLFALSPEPEDIHTDTSLPLNELQELAELDSEDFTTALPAPINK